MEPNSLARCNTSADVPSVLLVCSDSHFFDEEDLLLPPPPLSPLLNCADNEDARGGLFSVTLNQCNVVI
jgi:hypothetical protein